MKLEKEITLRNLARYNTKKSGEGRKRRKASKEPSTERGELVLRHSSAALQITAFLQLTHSKQSYKDRLCTMGGGAAMGLAIFFVPFSFLTPSLPPARQ